MELYAVGVAILTATLFFMLASTSPIRYSVGFLLLLAPFHLVTVLSITNSVAMAFAVIAGILLSGKRLRIPMLGSMLFVLLGYVISISQVDPSLYRLHGIFLITLTSGFAIFVLAYNLARNESDPRAVVDLVIVGNILVDAYCLVQLILGPGNSASILGFEALTSEANRGEGDPRLGGPFGGAPGIVAEYLALVTLILVYETLHSERSRRKKLWFLIAINVGLIVATGNRGGIVTLVAGLAGFVFLFRKDFGTMKTMQLVSIAAAILALSSVIVIELTDFNVMFNRLARIGEMKGMIPETRQVVWPQAWERFKEVPWFGQGPQWTLPHEEDGAIYPGHAHFGYPHSLYLYLLVTVGIFGTTTFAVLFFVLGSKMLRSVRETSVETTYVRGLVRLGPLLLVLFLLDEIRIEFLRPTFSDYQHVIFGLFGLWLGLGHRVPAAGRSTGRLNN